MKSVIQVINFISSKINSVSNAWHILVFITKKNKSELLMKKEINLTSEQLSLIDLFIEKHVDQKIPLQYLIGSVPFGNVEILSEIPVLIPRPETEFWCHKLIDKLKSLNNRQIKILDIGTGTGCIAIALAKALPEAQIYATDISDDALSLARKNIRHNDINNVALIKSDLFENLNGMNFDIIVTNPPYIDEALFETLDESVKNWEDPRALITKNKGLHLIELIISGSSNYLVFNKEMSIKAIPQLVIEIDVDQAKNVTEYLHKLKFNNINIERDLGGKDRVVTARR